MRFSLDKYGDGRVSMRYIDDGSRDRGIWAILDNSTWTMIKKL